ncbi:MAG: S9 family peptidase [Flavobacteriales bacterium]|nr:S9 family peptidase [Flavobacteriales bacterium]
MYKHILPLALLPLLFTACNNTDTTTSAHPAFTMNEDGAPIAKKEAHPTTINGATLEDNYFWMRLSDEQKEAKTPDAQTKNVVDYLNAENAYTEKKLAHVKDFREKLFQEMKGRIKEDDQSVPVKDNGYWYYTRFEAGKDYAYYCRKKDSMETGKEEILVNAPERAAGHDYYSLGGWDVSEDNKILGMSEDFVSRRMYEVIFKNLEQGEMLPDKLTDVSGGGVTWANDNKTVFYTKKDTLTLRESQIWKHTLGTSQADDVMVYEEKDEEFYTGVYKTKSKKFIVIASTQTLTSEYRVLDADNPDAAWQVIQPRTENLEYSIDHYEDKFYIVTNLDAKNFRLMECPLDKTTKENWKDVIPHRTDVLLEGIEIFKEFLVVEERKGGLSQLHIKRWDGKADYYMEFQDPTYGMGVGTNLDFDTHILRYGYSSFITPGSTYDYDMTTKERKLLKQTEVVGGYNPEEYASEYIQATANDGTKIPVSIMYKKSLFKHDGTSPLLLYGYGSYGASMDAGFSTTRLSLLDRGFVYAIAHIRGGQELGRFWYEDGKLLKKKNTFTDFIDCGEFLVEQKYVAKDKLFAMGGSAGGLLMGAVTNMAPDLWRGVVSAVPFVDVINTMLDETIPLTTGEFDEWGNPKEKQSFDYMLSYSPYDQIEKKNYPNILITTGYWDSQVQYWEPAKYLAKMRDMKTDNNHLLMWCNMDAGHGGKSGRFEALKEYALEYAFMLDLAGIKE